MGIQVSVFMKANVIYLNTEISKISTLLNM